MKTMTMKKHIGLTGGSCCRGNARLTACHTSKQARSVTESGFLGDYSQLKKGKGDQAKLVYFAPGGGLEKIHQDVYRARPALEVGGSEIQAWQTVEGKIRICSRASSTPN